MKMEKAAMSYPVPLLLLALVSTHSASCVQTLGKVLIYPAGHCSTSLLLMMEKMASFLSINGYDVTMLINDKYTGSKGDIDMSLVKMSTFPAPEGVPTLCDLETMVSSGNVSMLDMTKAFVASIAGFCEALLDSNKLKDLEDEDYDLLILDRTDWCSAIIADNLDVQFMTFASVSTAFNFHELARYIHAPAIFNSVSWPMSIRDRLTVAMTHSVVYFSRYFFLLSVSALKVKYSRHPEIHITQVYDNAAMNLLYSDQEAEYPKPTYSHELEIGFLFVEITPTRIPPRIGNFITEWDDIVVISFGSQVSELTKEVNSIFLRVVSSSPDVLFIWHRNEMNPPLHNVMCSDWIPQTGLIASGRVKLLVTHGGLASTMEAMYYGVPMLVLPMQTEQRAQAHKLSDYLQVAEMLEMENLSEEDLKSAISRGLQPHTPQRHNVQRLSQNVKNRITPISKIFLHQVKRVIDDKGYGSPKTRPPSMHILQWILIDLLIIIFITILVILSIAYMICKITKTLCKQFMSGIRQLIR